MKLMIFDSNSILNRAFYGIKLLSTKDGVFTNAVYGFFNICLKLLEDQKPDRVAFAWDLKGPTFRHQLYDGYKATRKGMPEELAQQMPLVKEAIRYLGYPILEVQGYEADDILGTVARWAGEAGEDCLLVTGDRDSLQLVDDRVQVILAATRAGGAQYLEMTPAAIREQYGLEPRQLIEVKALMGDSSDNIPGVKGIGEKTALALIQSYHSVEEIYRDLDALSVTPSVRRKLEEGRELAALSRQLGEIYTQVPLTPDQLACTPTTPDPGALYRLLSRLELHTLIRRLDLSPDLEMPEEENQEPEEAIPLRLLNPEQAFVFPQGADLYLTAETTGDHLTALAVAAEQTVYYCEAPGRPLLDSLYQSENPKWAADSKPFYKDALLHGQELGRLELDYRLAGYLLSPNSPSYDLDRLAGEYSTHRPRVEHSAAGLEDCPPLAQQAALMPPLGDFLSLKIRADGMTDLLTQVEMPLAEVLASMEIEGFLIDQQGLAEFGQEMTQAIARLEEEIWVLAGHSFNIQSPKQMGTVLFEELGLPTGKKTKSGYSTDAEVLEGLVPHHPIISKILDYRKYAKLNSTYVEGLQKAVDPDSRIRTSFNQTEARTGRISSLEPNMQNIPIRTEPGSRMRSFFTAGPGRVLVDADYSQIELRVLAAVAKDQAMLEAFRNGEDIHTTTASQVFDMPQGFVTPLMRSRAKAVNFGIVYGISAFSLSKDLGVTVKEADAYIRQYLGHYQGVRDYLEQTVAQAQEAGYVSTLFGRRRYLPELRSSNHNLRSFGQRVAMNMPIQGTAADIIKIAMVRVYRQLKEQGLQARLILQVHDELIVECPEAEAKTVRALVAREMSQAADLGVPLEVDAKVGHHWGEAH